MVYREVRIDTLGGRVRAARQRLHITTIELARRTGLHRQAIEAYELNEYEPRLPALRILAEALHVSCGWLIAREGLSP
jgi:transcriptional regulator with XRE-family HTH domain